jgi:hypothetical protein
MWLAGIRDAAIVLLAVESVIIGILLALTLLQIRKLVCLLREEIAPMLDAAHETLGTVQGTTKFVSKNVVHPLIQVSSVSAGTLQALRSLFYIGRSLKGHGAGSSDDRTPGGE